MHRLRHVWRVSLGILVPMGVALGAEGTSKPAEGDAKMRCDEPTYTFVNPWSGDKLEHTFVIHNDGTGPLVITKIHPTCGCTVAGVTAPLRIAPGGEAKIPVTLTTPQEGEIHKQIDLESNDPVMTRLVLGLKANLKPRIAMVPNGAMWGRIVPGSPTEITVKLTNNTTEKMKIEVIPDATQTLFEGALKETEPGKAAEVTIKIKKPIREGYSNGSFRFKTGLTGMPELAVSCGAYLPPTVEVTPHSLFVNLGGIDFHQLVLVRYNGTGTMKIKSATCNVEQIKLDLSEKEPGKMWELEVTIPAAYQPKQDVSPKITIATDEKDSATVTIPMSIQGFPPATNPATQPAGVIEKR